MLRGRGWRRRKVARSVSSEPLQQKANPQTSLLHVGAPPAVTANTSPRPRRQATGILWNLPFGRNQRCVVFGFDKLPDPVGLGPLATTERAARRLEMLPPERPKCYRSPAWEGWMRRREFIAGLGGAAVWPIATRAQARLQPVIGYLSTNSEQQ